MCGARSPDQTPPDDATSSSPFLLSPAGFKYVRRVSGLEINFSPYRLRDGAGFFSSSVRTVSAVAHDPV